MKTNLKKAALVFAAIFAGTLLFAEKEGGAKTPAWVKLFDKAVESNTTGTLSHSKETKKLYKKLDVNNDKILFYSVAVRTDKDAAAQTAKAQAKDLAAKSVLANAQEIIDQKLGKGKVSLKQPQNILGYAKAQEFVVNKDGSFTAYSIWQITNLNYKEAANSLANDYLRANGYLPKSGPTNER